MKMKTVTLEEALQIENIHRALEESGEDQAEFLRKRGIL